MMKRNELTKICTFKQFKRVNSIHERFECRSELSVYEQDELCENVWDAEPILREVYIYIINPTTDDIKQYFAEEFHEYLTILCQLINGEQIPFNWPYDSTIEDADPNLVEYYESLRDERVRQAIRVFNRIILHLKKGFDFEKTPLSPKAKLIYEKLLSLEEHEAMKTDEILDWLASEHRIYLDEGTLRKHLKEIKSYGLNNKPRIGYYIQQF
ncbi:MAG: hypothetical protein CEE38_23400 [Planctomycetes bacterium B3_Pla]|nr:MAG: hypothetical protein CEE38_23400 [Planctomycetes bacterium B3_Pla]